MLIVSRKMKSNTKILLFTIGYVTIKDSKYVKNYNFRQSEWIL